MPPEPSAPASEPSNTALYHIDSLLSAPHDEFRFLLRMTKSEFLPVIQRFGGILNTGRPEDVPRLIRNISLLSSSTC